MLKRTLTLGMIIFYFGTNNLSASANTLKNISATSSCTESCLISTPSFNSSSEPQTHLFFEDLVFKVVIGTFVEPLDIECNFLRKVRSDLTVEKTIEGRVRYAIGAFENYDKAHSYCESLKDKGYIHAEVMAYNQEEVLAMPMEEVLDLLENR